MIISSRLSVYLYLKKTFIENIIISCCYIVLNNAKCSDDKSYDFVQRFLPIKSYTPELIISAGSWKSIKKRRIYYLSECSLDLQHD